MRKITFTITLALFFYNAIAQNTFWKDETESSVPKLNTPKWITPQQYRVLSLNFDGYKNLLSQAPKEFSSEVGMIISLPFPDNSFQQFKIVETKMMEDALAAQLPGIKTFTGQGIDDPYATVRIDYTYQGFHAFIMSPKGNVFIDPYERLNNNLYISYYSKDYTNPQKGFFKCDVTENLVPNSVLAGTCIGTQLKTYRLALACTGEYAVAVCAPAAPTVLATASAMLTSVNRVVGVYEKEIAVRMLLVANNNNLIYLNGATDPYTNNNGGTMLGENISTVDATIGSANYDIGHVFSTGGGGVAYLGVVCNATYKAGGVTGSPNPVGDDYDIDYVAHEMGHQFGADHTFESKTGACGGGNRNGATSYEVGSGTTIMAYAGICGTDDIQPHSDPYFHTVSFDQITAYITSGGGLSCAVVTATGNNPPNITMPTNNLKIPYSTPFVLNASATDPNGDALTYNWEEWDLSQGGNGSAWDAGAGSTSKPLFKSRIPKTTGERYFPSLQVILAGFPANPPAVMDGLKGETMTTAARDIKFRLTVRDNRAGGGGVATGGDGCNSSTVFKVTTTSDGPFIITNPNTAVVWAGNSSQTVTWNVANTNSVAGINCQFVGIFMSTDGGYTYPTTIIANTANDGSQIITVPNITTTNARFMIKAVGNIFFDISDVNFIISAVVPVNFISFNVVNDKDALRLNWNTAQEINNKGFDVQRSEGNASAFTSIAFVNGTGNSSTLKKYTLTDRNIKKGTDYFYRIRQVDYDGGSAFSSIERGKINEDGFLQMLISPNPVSNTVQVALNGIAKEKFSIIITDMAGKILSYRMYNNTASANFIKIDLPGYAKGLYIIKLFQNNTMITQKFIKQ